MLDRGTSKRLTIPGVLLFALVAVTGTSTQGCAFIELVRLNQEVKHLHAQGKYNDAIPLAQKALSISEESEGRDSVITGKFQDRCRVCLSE